MNGIEAYPLCWPSGWKRANARVRSAFKTAFDRARKQLFHELELLRVNDFDVILSTNIPLRNDGMPYANHAQPKDPGVAVYFKHKGRPMVFASDKYLTVTDNLYAIVKTVEAIRGIERWGTSDMIERSFTGFMALPAPSPEATSWWVILGVPKDADHLKIWEAWRRLNKKHHPDLGGSHEKTAEINRAYEEAVAHLTCEDR